MGCFQGKKDPITASKVERIKEEMFKSPNKQSKQETPSKVEPIKEKMSKSPTESPNKTPSPTSKKQKIKQEIPSPISKKQAIKQEIPSPTSEKQTIKQEIPVEMKVKDIHENRTNKKIHSEKIAITTWKYANNSGHLEEHYKILNILGNGRFSAFGSEYHHNNVQNIHHANHRFGMVYRVVHKKTEQIRAMKMIKKSSIDLQDDDNVLLKEIHILIQIDHPNILKIYEYFQDASYFYVITDFISGGELYDTITTWKTYNEDKAAYIMIQLLSGVNYLHLHNIVHRDLNPRNIMVEKKSISKKEGKNAAEIINIKLIDFGTSSYFDRNTKLKLRVGNQYYIAPEVLCGSYDEKCDIWSCGVILYILLCGYPPFSGNSKEETMHNVMQGKFTMDGDNWRKVSPSAKDLITKLLELKADKRLSAQDAINHKWIQEKHEAMRLIEKVDDEVWINVLENIKNFNTKEKLQQAIIAYIVHFQFASQENEELKNIFKKLDRNGDGRLAYKELKEGYIKLYPNEIASTFFENDLNRIIEDCDQDMNGFIEYEEFLRVTKNKRNIITEKNLKLAFKNFDENKDGKLSKDELIKVLGISGNEYLIEIMPIIDENKDGVISFKEFRKMMKGSLKEKEDKFDENNNNSLTYVDQPKKDKDFSEVLRFMRIKNQINK